jgi:hypothetical protein
MAKGKRRNERKGRAKATKDEKSQDLVEDEAEGGGDTAGVVSSSLDNVSGDSIADQVELPISPESFLEFDDIETYSDNPSVDGPFSMEELPDLVGLGTNVFIQST